MNNQLSKIEFTDENVALIKDTIALGATDNELKLFLYQCQRTGLDPMTRQIYFMKRSGKVTVQTSIDGFRVIAERSGDYAGQDEPQFIKDETGNLYCKVTVYRFRGETRYPAAVGVAYWAEYCPPSGQDFMWKKMPHTMLAKVAEALALRKAYPQDLSGIYTNDEMQQAPQAENAPEIMDVPDEDERQLLRKLVFTSTLDEIDRITALQSIDELTTYKQYSKIESRLQELQQPIETMVNPSGKDINKHLKKTIQ